MAYTIYGAFLQLIEEKVDLPAEVNGSAKTSIYSISTRLEELSDEHDDFPTLDGSPILYGSFARKTKCLPLDDLDFLLPLKADGVNISNTTHDRYSCDLTAAGGPLERFVGYYFLRSDHLLDSMRDSLKQLRSLKAESIDRRLQAVRVKLDFYDWNFDLVPAIPVKGENGGTSHYLIPNGTGEWWSTDPRVDARRTADAIERHTSTFLSLMRLVKRWNYRWKPKLGSYHLETLVTEAMRDEGVMYSIHLPSLLEKCFSRLERSVFQTCPDPKGLGPDLDLGVDWLRRAQISRNLSSSAYNARRAIQHEAEGDTENAFEYWQSVFGPDFPSYGG